MSVRTFELTPEEAYEVVLAGLRVCASVSPSVHKRIQVEHDAGGRYLSRPGVGPDDLVELRAVLNRVGDGMADRAIGITT
jgi:hypothetical protein